MYGFLNNEELVKWVFISVRACVDCLVIAIRKLDAVASPAATSLLPVLVFSIYLQQ